MPMKNIIFLTYLNLWSIEASKGAPSFYKTVTRYLSDGWNVTLINPKYDVGETPVIEGLHNATFHPYFAPGERMRKFGFIARILHSLQGDFCLYRLGRQVLEQYGYKACIYAYEVNGVKAGQRLARRYGLPFITRFQGTVLAPVRDTPLNRLRKYPHFQALKTGANVTIMTDDGTQGDTVLRNLQNSSERIEFWRNGVDIRSDVLTDASETADIRRNLGIRDTDRILLTVSRLAAWKKVSRALEALAVAARDNPRLKLVVVGDGDEMKNLTDLAKKLGIENQVIFAGAVKQDSIKNYFDLADIFLSLYDLSNVGNPLLEAMSCGKPIITLNVGDTASLVKNGDNGILLDVGQLDEIPAHISRILQDKEFALKIGENARKYAKENFWSWEDRMNAEADVVERLYTDWTFKTADNKGNRG